MERLEIALGLGAIDNEVSPPAQIKTVFLPTNGNGLGHAKRCTLIASEMKTRDISFAAFPSCIGLINHAGFPSAALVSKSSLHEDEYAGDILNYLRLKMLFQAGDRLIFDGGYVFDSIMRVIVEEALDATWIRRGLWQPGQVRQSTLGREKVFRRVIAPAEAFDELNAPYSHGDHVHNVGPIVQIDPLDSKARSKLRKDLKSSFKNPFKELVVTMLGGGVAADRTAQTQALCGMMALRPDCLHLVIVWPGARVPAALYGWPNTRVVKTKNALALCQTADLVISAVGYNSYHEILYHRIPAIFIPQMAPFMDDQEKRARAASDRDLAATVLADEIMSLEQQVVEFLDAGKADRIRAALQGVDLPETGTAQAAVIIEQGGAA